MQAITQDLAAHIIHHPSADRDYAIPASVLKCGIENVDIETVEENLPTRQGMDDLPEPLFNKMLEILLIKGKFRDAMLLTLHANFGMRNSDVSRIRFIELIKPDGTFRTRLSAVEKKTSKIRQFYINEAVRIAVATYLQHNPHRKLLDYMIVSERKKTYEEATVQGNDGTIIKYRTQAPLSRIQEERVIKDTLIEELGIVLRNDARCSGGDIKLNTHSLRKMYSECFAQTAYRLKEQGVIKFDTQIINLIQMDFAHSNEQTTLRYNRTFEKYKEIICNTMNVGLDVWKNYLAAEEKQLSF